MLTTKWGWVGGWLKSAGWMSPLPIMGRGHFGNGEVLLLYYTVLCPVSYDISSFDNHVSQDINGTAWRENSPSKQARKRLWQLHARPSPCRVPCSIVHKTQYGTTTDCIVAPLRLSPRKRFLHSHEKGKTKSTTARPWERRISVLIDRRHIYRLG